MKRKILYALMAMLLTSGMMQAQEFINEDFNSYSTGDVSSDLSGVTGGQGNWKVFAARDARLSDFQIKANAGNGNVLVIKSPDAPSTLDYDNVKFAWKEFAVNAWEQRTSGNNILRVEYEFYTGERTPTSAAHRNITTSKDGTFLAGFQYEPALGVLRGMTRLNIAGETKLQFITLKGAQADLTLPANTWVKVAYQINFVTNAITFQIPLANIDGNIPTVSLSGQQPMEINFASYLGGWDIIESTIMYDNYKVSAINDTPVLSVDDKITSNFVLYPNPVVDVVTISSKENNTIEQLRIFDTNGRQVYSQNCNKETELSLNLADLTAGIYILHITNTEGTTVKKLIKQ